MYPGALLTVWQFFRNFPQSAPLTPIPCHCNCFFPFALANTSFFFHFIVYFSLVVSPVHSPWQPNQKVLL